VLWRAGDIAGGAAANANYEFTLAGPDDPTVFDECFSTFCTSVSGVIGQPLDEANRVVVPSANLGGGLFLEASCSGRVQFECPAGKGDANNYAAAVYLYAADLTLEQTVGPTASNVGGELASAASLAGTSDVTFTAADSGSGVYEALFAVDGQLVQRSVIDDDGGRCRDVGSADGLPAFLYLQPCPAQVSADVGFDTTHVAAGAHHLVVSVIDAAGNAAPVLDRNVTFVNPPPPGAPNGAGASPQATLQVSWTGSRRARVMSAYGHRHAAHGRLLAPGGSPIAGAEIEVLPSGAGATAIATPRTDANGRFTFTLPASTPSRTLRFVYRSHFGEAQPAATRTLTLDVRAALTLSIAPRSAGAGGTIRFKGALRGGPVPAAGKLLVLEARAPGGRWIEFDVVRSDRRGRYRAHYTFKFAGPANYEFRVLCEPESDYPYALGVSRVVGVHER
jgi:hypothetical protein